MMGGGSVYWGRKEESKEVKGIAVMFSWISINEKHIQNYVDLYSSLGWNSLVSRADFLNVYYPERAMTLAFVLLNELLEVLKIRTCPVVFVAFSGSPKACMYKVLQIIQGTGEGQFNSDGSQLIRNCVSGQIYDSSPVDFASDLNAQFALHPSIRKMPGPSKLVSWIAKGVASGLDGLYLTGFESQRVEYWQTLYSSVDLGAPYLILCSENDDLASYPVINNFARCLQDLGAGIEVVKWNGSAHLGLSQTMFGLLLLPRIIATTYYMHKLNGFCLQLVMKMLLAQLTPKVEQPFLSVFLRSSFEYFFPSNLQSSLGFLYYLGNSAEGMIAKQHIYDYQPHIKGID